MEKILNITNLLNLSNLSNLLHQPFLMVLLTLAFYESSHYLTHLFHRKFKLDIIHPQLVTIFLLMGVLYLGNIDYAFYKDSTKIISFLLAPATVALAIPLYRQWTLVRRYWPILVISLMMSSLTVLFLVWGLCHYFGLDMAVTHSLLPKSVTMPIGLELSNHLKGFEAITALSIIITGLTGATTAPFILHRFRIKNPIAQGVAIGMSSHALGTARALEIGELQGAMSSVALALTGLFTVLWVTIFFY